MYISVVLSSKPKEAHFSFYEITIWKNIMPDSTLI